MRNWRLYKPPEKPPRKDLQSYPKEQIGKFIHALDYCRRGWKLSYHSAQKPTPLWQTCLGGWDSSHRLQCCLPPELSYERTAKYHIQRCLLPKLSEKRTECKHLDTCDGGNTILKTDHHIALFILLSWTAKLNLVSGSLEIFAAMHPNKLLIKPYLITWGICPPILMIETTLLSKWIITIFTLLSRTEKLGLVSSSIEIFAAMHPGELFIGLLPSDVRNLLNLYWRVRLHSVENGSLVS